MPCDAGKPGAAHVARGEAAAAGAALRGGEQLAASSSSYNKWSGLMFPGAALRGGEQLAADAVATASGVA